MIIFIAAVARIISARGGDTCILRSSVLCTFFSLIYFKVFILHEENTSTTAERK